MFKYIKKYNIVYYFIGLLPAMIYLGVAYVNEGINAFMSLWTWVSVLLIVIACSFVAARILNREAEQDARKILYYYYEKCDPYGFLEQGQEMVKKIKVPFNEWGSLFMGAYSLASFDVGDTDSARKAIEKIRTSALATKRPIESAHMCLNMHAPIKAVYGIDLALQCLLEAQTKVNESSNRDFFKEELLLIEQERKYDIAEKMQDDEEIIKLYSEVYQNEKFFMRMRVKAAYIMADAYARLEQPFKERECLEFVAQHGNKLPMVAQAKARLQ